MSPRLPDVTKKYTLEVMNKAINLCEKWDNFLDIGACTGHYSTAFLQKFKKGMAVEATPNQYLIELLKKYSNLSVKTAYIQWTMLLYSKKVA